MTKGKAKITPRPRATNGKMLVPHAALQRQIEARTRELRESEERFRRLVDHAADAFFLIAPGGRIVDVNLRACNDLSYPREKLTSLLVRDVAPDLKEEDLARMCRQLGAGTPVTLETSLRRKDGSLFSVEARVGLIDIGGLQHMIALVRDITERKRAEEALRQSEEKYRTLFDSSRNAIFITARDGGVVEVNQATLDLFGYSRGEAME